MIAGNKLLENEFPLHWAVFRNDYPELMATLERDSSYQFVNKVDCRGRTPLLLSIKLGHLQCMKALLEKGADTAIQGPGMWTSVHEAICFGNPEIVKLVMQYNHHQRALRTSEAMERLLKLLQDSSDFYAEMSWEFTSWLPFVSKMCPSDTYKIYKCKSSVRIDTTLIGFDSSSSWKRGNQSFIFRFSDSNCAQLIVLDHDNRTATINTMDSSITDNLSDFTIPEETIHSRLTSPVDTTYVDIEKIGFERSRGGNLLSWLTSSENTDSIDGYKCKIYNASNVEIVTKTRTDHLSEDDKERFRKNERENPLYKVLKLVEKREECTTEMKRTGSDVYFSLTPQQYLDKNYDLGDRDIGLPKQVTKKSNSFKATVWLCDQYPLDLQDQVLPIIDLMAVNNSHFARLKNFIQLQLPAGFPIKIEIPLFHVFSARITFSNVNKPGSHVTVNDIDKKVFIDEAVFEIPPHYHVLTGDECATYTPQSVNAIGSNQRYIPEDELYLQFALEQSMREAAGLPTADSFYDSVIRQNEEDPDLSYAIVESLNSIRLEQSRHRDAPSRSGMSVWEEDYEKALELSQKEHEQRMKLEREQEEEIERVLKLSLIEK